MFIAGEIDGVIIKKMELFSDSRGWLMELFREDNNLEPGFQPAMSYISVTKPSVTRGPHEHMEQTDYFCFLGKFNLYLWDNRKDSPTYKNKKIQIWNSFELWLTLLHAMAQPSRVFVWSLSSHDWHCCMPLRDFRFLNIQISLRCLHKRCSSFS